MKNKQEELRITGKLTDIGIETDKIDKELNAIKKKTLATQAKLKSQRNKAADLFFELALVCEGRTHAKCYSNLGDPNSCECRVLNCPNIARALRLLEE